MQADLIDFVEAVYRIELGEADWMTGVLRAARPCLDGGLGVAAYTYDASNPAAVCVDTFVAEGMSEATAAAIRSGIAIFDSDFVRGSLLSLSCGTTR